MYLRIALVIALVAGLASVGVNYTQVKEKIETLQSDLSSTKDTLSTTQRDLSSTKNTLRETQDNLKETTASLVDTRAQLDETANRLSESEKLAQQKMADLERTEKSLTDANSKLSRWNALGLEPEGVRQMQADLRDAVVNNTALLDENNLLNRKIVRIQNDLDRYTKGVQMVMLPEELKGKVTAVDPKWDFVVLDIGSESDVQEQGELLVSREGRLIARVRVNSVETNYSIASVMPGWLTDGETIVEGDTVMAAKF
jgi:predicted nuclease with TOPRIM domain